MVTVSQDASDSSDAALASRAFTEVARMLLRAEGNVRLLSRTAPADAGREAARLTQAYVRGQRLVLERTREAPEERALLTRTLSELERVRKLSSPFGALGALHAERAAELELEARLALALDTPALRALAAERFPAPNAALARECDGFVADALAAPVALATPPGAPSAQHLSHDESDASSLVLRLRARARELRLNLSVRILPGQIATAATGDGVVLVRPGVLLSAAETERITVHELFGHALPRARASYASFELLRAGTRGSADDEEGRALLVESRAGLLGAERRRELSLRHVAALGVRQGDEPRDTVTRLTALGAPLERAIELMLRVQRGGGLAREIVYLPAYFAVRRAFAEDPGLERWFERGRVDLSAARAFTQTPPAPECGRTASADAAAPRRSPLA